jgi:hypothetical protein
MSALEFRVPFVPWFMEGGMPLSTRVVDTTARKQSGSPRPIRTGLIAGAVISVLISSTVWLLAVAIPAKTGSPFAPIRNLCEWIAGSSIGRGILESVWVFPIIEGFHLMGIALSIGVLCWLDLRLIGIAFTDLPISKVWKQVVPVAGIGFALMFVTGGLLILLAGLNALYFERVTRRGIQEWDDAPVPPFKARLAGLVSLILWSAVIITGRTMAYSF